MSNQALILDYEGAPLKRAWGVMLLRFACAIAHQGWQKRHRIAATMACGLALWSIARAWSVTLTVTVPIHGGCGTGRFGPSVDFYSTGMSLWLMPAFWFIARRGLWSSRITRTSSAIAIIWWLCCYIVMGRYNLKW